MHPSARLEARSDAARLFPAGICVIVGEEYPAPSDVAMIHGLVILALTALLAAAAPARDDAEKSSAAVATLREALAAPPLASLAERPFARVP